MQPQADGLKARLAAAPHELDGRQVQNGEMREAERDQ
jgi:hypothetical protein